MKNKDILAGKILDFFTVIEIRRSNLFKALFRAAERFISKHIGEK